MGHRSRLIHLACCLGCVAIIQAGNLFLLPEECIQTVQAAESSVIEAVDVTVKAVWGDAEELLAPKLQVSGSGISLADVRFGTEPEKWKPGKKVRLEMNVAAEPGKYFPARLESSRCHVKGASFVSVRTLDDHTIQIKADYVPVSVLGSPQKVGWSSRVPGKAVWERVNYAPGYEVILYGNDKVIKRMNVTGGSAELGEFMKDPDQHYYYEVKAVPVTAAQKKYLKAGAKAVSSELELDLLDLAVIAERQAAKEESSRVGQTGWVFPGDGFWYYLNPDGSAATGWIQPTPATWYYLHPDGRMHTGWLQQNGVWYYLHPDGRMHTGWLLLDSCWYYMNDGGDMAINVVRDGWRIGVDGIGRKE